MDFPFLIVLEVKPVEQPAYHTEEKRETRAHSPALFRNGGFFMKKLLAGILAAALMAAIGMVGVSAAGRGANSAPSAQTGARYADQNGDGICDNFSTGGAGRGGYGSGKCACRHLVRYSVYQ